MGHEAKKRQTRSRPKDRMLSERTMVQGYARDFGLGYRGNLFGNIDSDSVALILDIDNEDAESIVRAGVLRVRRTPIYPGSLTFREEIPAAELLRWLRAHGAFWFRNRLALTLSDLEQAVAAEVR